MIHLVDVNTVLEVPQSISPTMQDPTTDHLEDYLGSLYLDGNTKCDSYDVGLSLTTPLGVSAINRPSPQTCNRLRKEKVVGLTKRLEIVEETLKAHREDVLRDHKITLERTQLILQVETFDRILQAYNDKIFQQLNFDEIETLRKLGVSYITKLLIPPATLTKNEIHYVENALSKLLQKEYHAACSLLPILNSLKSGPNGCNTIQHPVPTLEEGIDYIKNSTLEPDDKFTLIASLKDGLESKRGDKLFISANNGETAVEILEWEIQDLEAWIVKFR